MNLIEELYYGAISPSAKICIDNSSYQEAMNVASRNEEILSAFLEGKEKSCSTPWWMLILPLKAN